jgi:tyrosine-protein phosphatase SIW14
MKGTKKEDIPVATMKAILRVVLDRRNHPLLIHCNHGKVNKPTA